jgi:hypothetical protein
LNATIRRPAVLVHLSSVEEARPRLVAAMAARPSEHLDLGEVAGRVPRAACESRIHSGRAD